MDAKSCQKWQKMLKLPILAMNIARSGGESIGCHMYTPLPVANPQSLTHTGMPIAGEQARLSRCDLPSLESR